MSYREDLASAAARLARLDAAHAMRKLDAQRDALEDARAELVAGRGGLEAVVFFGAIIAAFVALRQVLLFHAKAMRGSRATLVVSLCIAALVGGASFWRKHRRLREMTDIDAELLELALEPHLPPETLAEAHERIRVREAEEEALVRRRPV